MIKKVCICGAGTMGLGIVQVIAAAGYESVLYDVNADMLQHAEQQLRITLDKLVMKGKMTEVEKENLWANLKFTTAIENCTADLVIEAIIEHAEVKIQLFQQLSAINGEATIFASNTSSLSISKIAAAIDGPERFGGLHFFNPAPLMKLVEVVKADQTSKDVMEQLVIFTRSLKKVPVVCKDAPGFIVNRVARPFYIEALRLLEDDVASVEMIDGLLESRGFKMGPFRLMDLIGNDVNYAVSCSVYEQMNHPLRLKPSFIQQEKVAEGALGKKSGHGYYHYHQTSLK